MRFAGVALEPKLPVAEGTSELALALDDSMSRQSMPDSRASG